MSRPMQVIAHRGANDEEPEHSLAAYLRAIEQGADGIECDVRLTSDGTLVCVHDRRIDRTSTGHGVVSSKTLAELSRYDYSGGWSTWNDFEDPRPDETRTSVLTLQTLLATMLEASTTIEFTIETKHPTRYGRYVEEELLTMLRHFGLTRPSVNGYPRARMMSFSRMAVQRTHELSPLTRTIYLTDRVPRSLRSGRLPDGAWGIGPDVAILRKYPNYVQKVHDHGGAVHVWTVDTLEDLQLCQQLEVDAVITNRPGAIRAMMSR